MKYFSEELTIDIVENLTLDDELLEEFNYDVDYKVHEEDEGYRYIIEKNAIQIPSLNIDIHYAIGEYLDDDTGDWQVDYDTYIFTEADTYNYIYSENSSIMVCIHNYCNINNIKVGCIGDLKCFLMKK